MSGKGVDNNKAPYTITLRICPKCGQTDRFKVLRDRHYDGKRICPGSPVAATYRFVKAKTI